MAGETEKELMFDYAQQGVALHLYLSHDSLCSGDTDREERERN